MKSFKKLMLLLLLLGALIWPGRAWASGGEPGLFEDKIVFGGTYTLGANEELDGNLVVLGGNATLETGSRVIGDVTVVGGNLSANGEIDGNVSCIGGNINLLSSAYVTGDVTVWEGANLAREDGARIGGEVNTGITGPVSFDFPRWGQMPGMDVRFTPVADLVWFLFQIFFWAALAVLLVMFLPRHLERTADAAASQPAIAGGVGLLTVLVAPLVLIFLAITILLLPVALLGVLLLAVVWLFGLTALGLEVGRRIEAMFHTDWPLAVSAGVGTFVLTLVVNGAAKVLPCIGLAFPFLAAILGIGAVLLTRFGTHPYPPAAVAVPPASAPPPPPVGPVRTYTPVEADVVETPPVIDEGEWRPVDPDEPAPPPG